MSVLIVTHSADHDGVDAVIARLVALGAEPVRLDTDRFPTGIGLSIEQTPDGESATLTVDGRTHDLADVEAIWYRRLRAPRLPDDMPADFRGVAAGESRAVLLGLINSLPAFRLDPWDRIRHADHKQRQQRMARQVGLRVPPTLTTNDPDAVRAFAARCPGGVITKMLSAFALKRDGDEKVVYTNALSEADLAALDGLSLCPMVFQARIERKLELRCTVVGHRVLCGALSVEASDAVEAADDWRRQGKALAGRWVPYDLPEEIARKLRMLATMQGLNYGAADLLVDADGRHHFLEMNPAGEWGWMQAACDLPIAQAIADVLVDPAARRVDGYLP